MHCGLTNVDAVKAVALHEIHAGADEGGTVALGGHKLRVDAGREVPAANAEENLEPGVLALELDHLNSDHGRAQQGFGGGGDGFPSARKEPKGVRLDTCW
jgi:hypothetical protein